MSSDPLIQTAFILNRDEFAKAQKMTRRELPRAIRTLSGLQCGILLALILLPVAYRPEGELQPFSLVFVGLVWVVLITSSAVYRMMVNMQYKRLDGKELRYEFNATGFSDSSRDGESRVNWSGVSAVVENDALFVILCGALFYTVPKRVLSQSEIETLHRLLAEKIPAAKQA